MSSGKKGSDKALTPVHPDDWPYDPHPKANPDHVQGYKDSNGNFWLNYNSGGKAFPKGGNTAIVGSRNYPHNGNVSAMKTFIDRTAPSRITSGGAKGADRTGRNIANNKGIAGKDYYPDWSKGKGAGMQRNADIVNNSDSTAAFYGKDGRSRGTANTVGRSIDAGHPTIEVFPPE